MKRTLLSLAGFTAALVGYGAWVTSAPSTAAPSGDAVVVHAGGGSERLDHALELMAEDAAGVLVIMRGTAPTWPQANALCGRTEPFEVLCPPPDPDTTIGEALALRDLVATRGWQRVVTVTSDYHLRRAMMLDSKCTSAEIIGSAAPSQLSWPILATRAAREMGGMIQAVILSC